MAALSAPGRSCRKFYSTSKTSLSLASSTLCGAFRSCRYSSPTPTSTRVVADSSSSDSSPAAALRFSKPPNRMISAHPVHRRPQQQKKTCMCSPSTHPGAFRCSLHKNSKPDAVNPRPLAKTSSHSQVSIGAGHRYVANRALAKSVRSSCDLQQRRLSFKPRPSRFSILSRAQDVSLV